MVAEPAVTLPGSGTNSRFQLWLDLPSGLGLSLEAEASAPAAWLRERGCEALGVGSLDAYLVGDGRRASDATAAASNRPGAFADACIYHKRSGQASHCTGQCSRIKALVRLHDLGEIDIEQLYEKLSTRATLQVHMPPERAASLQRDGGAAARRHGHGLGRGRPDGGRRRGGGSGARSRKTARRAERAGIRL